MPLSEKELIIARLKGDMSCLKCKYFYVAIDEEIVLNCAKNKNDRLPQAITHDQTYDFIASHPAIRTNKCLEYETRWVKPVMQLCPREMLESLDMALYTQKIMSDKYGPDNYLFNINHAFKVNAAREKANQFCQSQAKRPNFLSRVPALVCTLNLFRRTRKE